MDRKVAAKTIGRWLTADQNRDYTLECPEASGQSIH